MSRATSISEEQILTAAREVFLRHGLRATTAEVAVHAGISEGSIFRRYPTKEALFHASMRIERPAWFDGAPELDPGADLRWALGALANRLIDFMVETVPVLHLVLSCGTESHCLMDEDSPFAQCFEFLTEFFGAHISAGQVSHGNPEMVARIFAGACQHFAFSEVSGLNVCCPIERTEFVDELVKRISGQFND